MNNKIDFDQLTWVELVSLYPKGAEILNKKFENYNYELLNYRPDIEDSWTISEHVRHLADSETNFYIRAKLAIAESGKGIIVLDEHVWQKKIYQIDEDVEDYLKMFEIIRRTLVRILKTVSEEDSRNYFVIHPVSGRMSLRELLKIYVRHVYSHLDYLDRNEENFKLKNLGNI